MHMCVKGNDFVSLCHFFLFVKCSDSVVFSWFLKCSDSVVFFWFFWSVPTVGYFLDFWSVPTVWYFFLIFEVFRQCGIFLMCSDSVVFFWFLKCSDSVVFFLYFWSVPTVWYFFYIFEVFRQWYLFVFHFIVPYVEMQSLRLWNDICNSVVFTFTTDVDIFITFLGSLVLEGIIRKVAIASSMTWFIKYSTCIVEIYSH
jgi:hypothetical protein